jgi:DNA topoisomerase III
MIAVVAEKEISGRIIAKHLGATSDKGGYLEGNGYLVCWAQGHLIGLSEPAAYDPSFKKWSMEPLPIIPDEFQLTLNAKKQKLYSNIIHCFEKAQTIWNLGDADREAEIIFQYIYELSGENKPVERVFPPSSLNPAGIDKAIAEKKPQSYYSNLVAAAKCRSQSDWIVGLNGTRAFTVGYGGGSTLLSIGRIQTVVLSMIVERCRKIKYFVPEPYWELFSSYKDTQFKYKKGKLDSAESADALRDKLLDAPMNITKIERKPKNEKPPLLFDLSDLQAAMNNKFSFSATKTLQVLQGLYEKGYCTYPRTESNHLQEEQYEPCKKILTNLSSLHPGIAKIDISNLRYDKHIFDDSKCVAHGAITPTEKAPSNLPSDEEKLYQTVLTRFIAAFYPDCKKGITTITGIINDLEFESKGMTIALMGWREIESPAKEKPIPVFVEGESGPQIPSVTKSMTKPPGYYTDATLIQAMSTAGKEVTDPELKAALKERGIGTSATRHNFIETLKAREFIETKGKHLLSTPKGEGMYDLISIDTLKSPQMTGEWEYKLNLIAEGELDPRAFMDEIASFTKDIVNSVKNTDIDDKKLEVFKEAPLGKCPLCSADVRKSLKSYYCSSKECDFTVWKSIAKKTISPKHVQQLLSQGKTEEIKGFKNKENESFDAALKISEGKIVFHFDNEQVSLGISCPKCKTAILTANKRVVKCECGFQLWRLVANKFITESNLKTILSGGTTNMINAFKGSKPGAKQFSAKLKLDDEFKIKFIFDKPKSKFKKRPSGAQYKK